MNEEPTPHADVNEMVRTLMAEIESILDEHIIGIYLDGSLAYGDFDEDSDIDFVVVTNEKIDDTQFAALHAMHARLNAGVSKWATQLEGSYLSRHAIRRYHRDDALHPNIERGLGEPLKWAEHDAAWQTHRYVLHERGIVIEGPPAHALIDPVSADDLRVAMGGVLAGWGARLLAEPVLMRSAGYQSYVVLSLCRILFTLDTGTVASKRVAAEWAKRALGEPWAGLIERAWHSRSNLDAPATREDVDATRDLIRFTIDWQSKAETRSSKETK